MRLDLNLAKEPFRNRTLFWLVMLTAFLVVSVVGLAVLMRAGKVGADTDEYARRAAEQDKSIAALTERLDELKAVKSRAVFTAEDRLALDDARKLINEKAFSWSRFLDELEQYVPKGSKLVSIEVLGFDGEGPQRTVHVQATAQGHDQAELAKMLDALDRSAGRFEADPIEIVPPEEGPDYTYSISIKYHPSGSGPPAPEWGSANE